MYHAPLTKVIALVVIIALSATYLFAQYDEFYDTPPEQTQQPTATAYTQTLSNEAQGTLDGERDASGNLLYGCGGFACGVFGLLAAAISNPQPNAAVIAQLYETKGTEYALAYKYSYSKKARNQNMLYAGIGWAVTAAAALFTFSTIYDY